MGPSVSSGASPSARFVGSSNQFRAIDVGVVDQVAQCVLQITSSARQRAIHTARLRSTSVNADFEILGVHRADAHIGIIMVNTTFDLEDLAVGGGITRSVGRRTIDRGISCRHVRVFLVGTPDVGIVLRTADTILQVAWRRSAVLRQERDILAT